MTLTLSGQLSHAVRLASKVLWRSETPKVLLLSVWPFPLSLATTRGISFDFSSSPYLDVSVRGVPLIYLFDSVYDLWFFIIGVPTFGNLRIEAYLQLPAAYRSLSRPSSAPNAKAFSICSSSLELPYVFDPSSNLRLLRINITVLSSLSLELLCVSYFAVTWSRLIYPPLAKLFVLPFLFWRKNLISNCYRFLCFFPLLCLSCMSH